MHTELQTASATPSDGWREVMTRRVWRAAALAALLCFAQNATAAERVFRIGVLTYAGDPNSAGPRQIAGGSREPIQDLLAARGYVSGKNVEFRYRAGGRDMALTEKFARELVEWRPDLLIGQMTNANLALRKATAGTNIPVVFWSTDPLEAGLVEGFRRSGTNFTGFSYEPWIELLQLRILKLVKPDIKRVAHLYNHTYAPAPSTLREIKASAKLLGMEIKVYETLKKSEFAKAFEQMSKDGMEGVTIGPHELFNTNGDTLGALAIQHQLPVIGCCQVSIARGGGLASFSPPYGWPAMADRIALILEGKAQAADLPIVRSIASPLTLNLKTAERLGLQIPPALIEEATTLIQ